MVKRKVTVVLFHDDEAGGYVAVMPTFPHCTTQGDTVGHALAMAKECLELNLQEPTDWDLFDLDHAYSEHVVVGTVEVDVPLRPESAKSMEDATTADEPVAVTTED
jgi:predicted RNase H-like HicB family nuclease